METGIDPAVLTLISTLFVAIIGNFWHQNREGTKTRALINDTRIELHGEIKDLHSKINDQGDQLRGEIKDLHSKINDQGDQLRGEIKTVDDHVRSLSIEVAKLGGQFTEFKTATQNNHAEMEKNHAELRDGLNQNGERLARIEGHLGIGALSLE